MGVWQGQTRDILGYPAQAEVVFEPNGEFTQLFRSSSGMTIRVWGTYRVEGNPVRTPNGVLKRVGRRN